MHHTPNTLNNTEWPCALKDIDGAKPTRNTESLVNKMVSWSLSSNGTVGRRYDGLGCLPGDGHTNRILQQALGGFIGGGESHESVRNAAKKMVAVTVDASRSRNLRISAAPTTG